MNVHILKEQVELGIITISAAYSFLKVLPRVAKFITRASDAFDLLTEIKTTRELPNILFQPTLSAVDMFTEALDLILAFEGGYVNDPADPGGATNYGVIQKTYDAYRDSIHSERQSVKAITQEEVAFIYKRDYWDATRCNEIAAIDSVIALAYFDCCVNNGSGAAGRVLQRCCGVIADGIVGPKTLVALQTKIEANRSGFQMAFFAARLDLYLDIVMHRSLLLKFLPSWGRRLQKLMEKASATV